MAPPAKKKLKYQRTLVAYMQAYMITIDWDRTLGADNAAFLSQYAKSINSSINIVAPILLANVSALIGPSTKVAVSEKHKVTTNLYLIVVAVPGRGKTPAFSELCEKPFDEVQKFLKRQLIVDDFTRSGLISAMKVGIRVALYMYIVRIEILGVIGRLYELGGT